ncbi:hypothetical protein DOS68_09285 [Staphylococcus felis]|uniref:DNA-binding response regulator n=5 Tax=Staphylococcus felis TaxID=46127 RepID=A0AAX1RWX7_9STAP|nr:LytTR family DNA-binding domain-containing protein [Staphylococcus felis]REH82935.1 hypothetical protein DOS56_07070 [Staphylococcus felis]REH84949.1 hypothetical protein DOS63_05920 [Staphylococcus felis]REH89059.1 hypothetical protein DOS68_09285 [Staphylococcus felis]REI23375.1 hypothetical protein DOS76_03835 [Staphylococcus felis]REI26223.1 hypothetical protein DOS79_11535 [Staphylococcus felis]
MKKMNIIIIDDNPKTRNDLKTNLSYFSFVSCVGDYSEYLEAKKILSKEDIDLIFLKIDHNNYHFVDIADNINSIHKNAQIVFLSTNPELAFKSFEAHPFDFLLHPIEITRLEKCLLNFNNRFQKKIDLHNIKNRKIGIKKEHSLYFLEIEKIVRAECRNRRIIITLNDDNNFSYNGSLKCLAKKLRSYGFILANRSLLLSLKGIQNIIFDKHSKCYILKLSTNDKIKITPEKYKKVKQKLNEFDWII